MSLRVGVTESAGALEALPPIPAANQGRAIIEIAQAPVTYVPRQDRSVEGWSGSLGETIRRGFRRTFLPAAAAVLAGSLLLSGCATTGGRIGGITGIPTAQVAHPGAIDQAERTLRSQGSASQLAALKAKLADPRALSDLQSLDATQILTLLSMEKSTKSFATPAMAVFIEGGAATQTENGGKWDEDKNRAWTVDRLGPNGSLDLLLFCPVSGHAKDHYPDALYRQFTSYQSAPADDHQRMRANADIYSHNNSQYIYLTDDPQSYEMGKIVVADVRADGRHVTPVRVHLEGLEPGKTYEVRWSPFVGSDPNHPLVGVTGFKNGRSFRLIVPAHVR